MNLQLQRLQDSPKSNNNKQSENFFKNLDQDKKKSFKIKQDRNSRLFWAQIPQCWITESL